LNAGKWNQDVNVWATHSGVGPDKYMTKLRYNPKINNERFDDVEAADGSNEGGMATNH
jgi:hypothetical protein